MIYFGIVYKEKEIATFVCSFAKIEPMETILLFISFVILFCAVWFPIFFDWMGKLGLESNVWVLLWLVLYIPFLTWIWIKLAGLI